MKISTALGKDKNGVKTEKLDVRSGNSSPEMSLSEVQAFLGQRFGPK